MSLNLSKQKRATKNVPSHTNNIGGDAVHTMVEGTRLDQDGGSLTSWSLINRARLVCLSSNMLNYHSSANGAIRAGYPELMLYG